MEKDVYDHRLPRLFVENDLAETITLPLDENSAHYLKNVLRRPDGSQLRVFNGRDGEFLASLDAAGKKNSSLHLETRIRAQPLPSREIHLVFAVIKKDRLDFMIEKAVELGATHFHPVLTQQTVIRDVNEKRLLKQIREAAEQCERLKIPDLSPVTRLTELLRHWPDAVPFYAAVEREDALPFGSQNFGTSSALLIGPEGGFSAEEKEMLMKNEKVKSVSFGEHILRAETAVLYGLSVIASRAVIQQTYK